MKTVLVAKQIATTDEPEQLRKAIPLSLIHPPQGPKRVEGKLVDYTVLGDLEDYQELEELYCPPPEPEPVEEVVEEPPVIVEEQTDTFERKEWLQKLHIFQRFREVREEHALTNWHRHELEWAKIESLIAKKLGKQEDDLLMRRLGEYRQSMEEKDLIEQAMLLLEERHVNFWKSGLVIGNDLLGLHFSMPRGGPREIRRVRMDEAPPRWKKDEYREQKKKELANIISKIDPFYNAPGGFLCVQGHGQPNELVAPLVERLETQSSFVEVKPKEEPKIEQASLVFSSHRLFFSANVNQVTSSIVTIHNQGTKAIHFEWQRQELTKITGKQRQGSFYLLHTRGVILPGTSFDFPIVFRSQDHGIFREVWVCETEPKLNQDKRVELQGMAIEPDTMEDKRKSIEELLLHRQAQTAAQDVIQILFKRLGEGIDQVEYRGPLEEEKIFTNMNQSLGLVYLPNIHEKLEKLARDTYQELGFSGKWDQSVDTLYDLISQLEDREARSKSIELLNQLVKEMTPQSKTHLRQRYTYDLIVEMAYKLVGISDNLRKQKQLPLQRSCTVFFPDQELLEEQEQTTDAKLDPKKLPLDPKKQPPPPQQQKDQKKPQQPPPKPVAPQKAPLAKKPENEEERPKLMKKPTSAQKWTPEQRALEKEYKTELKPLVRQMVIDTVDHLVVLLNEI
ncbi:MYCBP-associated protein family-domain-containing protein [Gorgonomyces haynaldii]|nr:MYCBP-associated protein family-domain-containing protein [Gorgonomyces haynaldii]